ncbi:EAL domain-containing protein [Alteromonas ponticola]|uniref:EAL domain-containing protein n=1 Tax=Alteromonas aquimaris TaxID=2998417 RepID=A0ABT3PAM2_9ALTE|nr:bifunctional diguanylate cyclase/phosphodiesterase [Alteromonas aquimaris]MCW8109759.1 EAL domain-containing protein [Alteromonas aquimaris]
MTELSDILKNLVRLEKRASRERHARHEAERLLTDKSLELYNALQTSQQLQKKLELALWASQESFWEWRADNDEFELRNFGLEKGQEFHWKGNALSLLRFVHKDDLNSLEFHWTLASLSGSDRIEVAFRFKRDGNYQWMRLRGRVLERNDEGTALHIVGTTRDITQERKAEQSFQLMASAFSSSREPMLVLSSNFGINECNSAFIRLMRLPNKNTCLGQNFHHLLPQADKELKLLTNRRQMRFETALHTLDGRVIPVDVSIALFEAQYQASTYYIATMRDISERKLNEDRLRQMAMHDDLTGLLNRNGLRESLNQLSTAQQHFTTMFIDLDGFKQINDAAGHEQGDECLKRLARTLLNRVNEKCVITRWGGDEFVILFPDITLDEAQKIGVAIIEDIEADKIVTLETEYNLSASIGLASFPSHGNSVDDVLQNADAAMYQAKTTGKGKVYIYQQGLLESMKERVSMLADLRRSINHRGLEFYIQGKYSIDGILRGGELLCRWRSSILGTITPAVFIPLAETHQLDKEIGILALEAACDYISMMETQGMVIPLSVNVTANQLLDKSFAQQAKAICEENDVIPGLIEMEVTESIFIRDHKSALRSLNVLREAGFKLALDDFGSGFSSLSYLRSFTFEVVKLDRSLLHDIHIDSKALSVFQGIVAMLHSLQLEVVVEGVEHPEYLPLLKDANVSQAQGFYFDMPMPYDQFIQKHQKK